MINFLNEKHAAYNLKESIRHMDSYKKLIQLERQASNINKNIVNSYIQLYIKYYKVNVSAKSYLNMI